MAKVRGKNEMRNAGFQEVCDGKFQLLVLQEVQT